METINITVKCDKKPAAPVMENIAFNIIELFKSAGSEVNKIELNYDSMAEYEKKPLEELTKIRRTIYKKEMEAWLTFNAARDEGAAPALLQNYRAYWASLYDLKSELQKRYRRSNN